MVEFKELKITPDGKNLIINASIKDLEYYKDVYIDSVIIDTQDTYLPSGPSSNPIYTKNFISKLNYKQSFLDEDFKSPVLPLKKGDKIISSAFTVSLRNSALPIDYTIKSINLCNTKISNPVIPTVSTIKNFEITENNPVVTIIGLDSSNKEVKNTDPNTNWNNTQLSVEINYETRNFKDINIIIPNIDTTIKNAFENNLLFVYIKTVGTPAPNTPCGMDNITTLGIVSNLYPLYQHTFSYIKELSNTCSIPKNFINYILQYKAFKLAVKTGHYTEAIRYWKKFFMGIKDSVITSNCGCYGQGT